MDEIKNEPDPTDEELVYRSQSGDRVAEELLLKRYSGLVKKEIRFLFLVGAEVEDLAQEGMIGLVKAIRDYTPLRGAAFRTYATSCVRNQIRSAITAAGRMKHQPLNTYISIYGDPNEEGEQLLTERALMEELGNPETVVLLKERLEEREEQIRQKLSRMERTVAELFLAGYSYAEIAERMGKDERSVNNALTRARNKLKPE